MSRAKGKTGQGGRGQNAAKRAANHKPKPKPGHNRRTRERTLKKHLRDAFNGTYLEPRKKQIVKNVRVYYGLTS